MVATGNDLQQKLFAETCCIIDQQFQKWSARHRTKKQRKFWGRNRLMWHSVIRNFFQLGRAIWNLPQGWRAYWNELFEKKILKKKFNIRCDNCQTSKIPGCVSGAARLPCLVSDWKRMGKSKYAWKSWQFILAISNHTHQANTNSVCFPNKANTNSVCFPNKAEKKLARCWKGLCVNQMPWKDLYPRASLSQRRMKHYSTHFCE